MYSGRVKRWTRTQGMNPKKSRWTGSESTLRISSVAMTHIVRFVMRSNVTIWRPGLVLECSGIWIRRRPTSEMKSICTMTLGWRKKQKSCHYHQLLSLSVKLSESNVCLSLFVSKLTWSITRSEVPATRREGMSRERPRIVPAIKLNNA